jgi:hypothetical protein
MEVSLDDPVDVPAQVAGYLADQLAWTVGSGYTTWEVLTGVEFAWLNVVIGMVLTSPWLGVTSAVVFSRLVLEYFASRGALPLHRVGVAARARTVALAVVNPLTMGVLTAVFFGPIWGAGTAIACLAVRQGVIAAHRTEKHRLSAAELWAALALTVVVLPTVAFATALDGRAWAPVLDCTVDRGHGPKRTRLIELSRKGPGVVGWNLEAEEVSNGTKCITEKSLVVRKPWWRS